MLKVKDYILFVKSNWNENKTAKSLRISSFLAGLIFNVVGVVIVAVWKYVFANNANKTKYCVRVALIGWFANAVIFFKWFAADPLYFISKQVEKVEKAPIALKKVYIDDFFNKEFEEMNKNFQRQREIFDNLFSALNEKSASNSKNKSGKINTSKKVIKDENGFETTIIEETGPAGYSKISTTKYVGKNKTKSDGKKNKIEKQNKKSISKAKDQKQKSKQKDSKNKK